jgi:hypothetical protein
MTEDEVLAWKLASALDEIVRGPFKNGPLPWDEYSSKMRRNALRFLDKAKQILSIGLTEEEHCEECQYSIWGRGAVNDEESSECGGTPFKPCPKCGDLYFDKPKKVPLPHLGLDALLKDCYGNGSIGNMMYQKFHTAYESDMRALAKGI